MRIGNNPEKRNNELSLDSYHRVIIPVYVPNVTDDYFKDGLTIFTYCIESLLHTIHPKTRITLVDNGCCEQVKKFLISLHNKHTAIDQLFHSDVNLGKINAIYAVVKSNLEPLFSITDADVLFLPGWQQAVEQVFEDFPEAGMVAPVPGSIAYNSSYVNATFYYGFSKGILKFRDVKDPVGMDMFQKSIGRKLYEKIHLEKYLTLTKGKKEAVIGCGHFVATLRAEALRMAPPFPTEFKIVGGSENAYIDKPNDDGGFLRLATMNNYAYHLGNKAEAWMQEAFEKVIRHSKADNKINNAIEFNINGIGNFKWFIGKVLFRILIRTKPIKRRYFKMLGMKNSDY